MLDKRVTYIRKCSYRTKSNRFRTVKTPGGKLAIQYIKKTTKGTGMHGVSKLRPGAFARTRSSKRSVSRAYGGKFSANEVRER